MLQTHRRIHVARWFALALLTAFSATTALAGPSPVNRTRDGLAIHGYDPVAYFEDGHPTEGSEQWTVEWNGAVWRFASQEHRDAFAARPEAYAPRYGGYCSWAMSQGSFADVDPEAWDVVDGKLYLNYSPKIRKRWLSEAEENIRKADQNWPRLLAAD